MNWEINVRQVIPYVPGEQPKESGIVKLNTNENPYPPAPEVEEVMERFCTENLRLYPDPEAAELVNALAEYYKVNKDQVFVGVGSDDVLAMSFLTFFNSTKPILFPDITYSFYEVWADLFRIPYKKIPLQEDFTMKGSDYCQENGGIIFPNPNAPTGVLEDISLIEKILQENQDSVVIVDEAYIDFGGISCKDLIPRYENLLVVQTFSKSRSMAGLRIGFALGSRTLIQYLNNAKFSFNSYTMNQPSLQLGKAVLENEVYFRESISKIIGTRERIITELEQLGFSFSKPSGNFVFVTHKDHSAKDLFEALKGQKIFVRYFDKPRIDQYLRITIGTDEQMDRLIEALKGMCGKDAM